MSAKSDERDEDARFRVMRLLDAHPDYSQRQIAAALGLSLGGVNYCLNALIEKGLVKVSNFRASAHKMGYAYILTPGGIAEKADLTGRFLVRKMKEFEALRAEIASLKHEAGSSGNMALEAGDSDLSSTAGV